MHPHRLVPPALLLLGAVLASAAPRPAAASETPWLHVSVTGAGDDDLRVQVPLSVARLVLDAGLEQRVQADVRRGLPGTWRIADLRALWKELKSSGEREILRAQGGAENVRLRLSEDAVVLTVERAADAAGEAVTRVELPAALIDVALGGTGEQLDLRGVIQALSAGVIRDVVSVDDGPTRVRVWVE